MAFLMPVGNGMKATLTDVIVPSGSVAAGQTTCSCTNKIIVLSTQEDHIRSPCDPTADKVST